jgi:Secretion system C-terminal sorting domain
MQKTFILLLFCSLHSLLATAQIVQSNCSVSPSLRQNYEFDIYGLLDERIVDSTNIFYPNNIIEPYWNDLAAILNTNTAASRAVFNDYCIHISPRYSLISIYVKEIGATGWGNNWAIGNRQTSNVQADALLASLGANVEQSFNTNTSSRVFKLTFTKACNRAAVGKALKNLLPNIQYTERVPFIGEMGTDLSIPFFIGDPNTRAYTFEVQWGDCPAGCIYNHTWNFMVNSTCQVNFMGEQGSALPSPATNNCAIFTNTNTENDENRFQITPNPVFAQAIITVSDENLPLSADLYNDIGQLIKKIAISDTKTAVDMADLPNGVYFLSFLDKNNLKNVQKIIVLK